MSTQQDIYAAGSENRPPMLKKDNYVPWFSRLLRYAKSKPNGKLLVNSIKNGLYVRQMIIEPSDPNSVPPVAESSHKQTYDELTEKEAKQMKADDQAIQTILMGLPEDIYVAIDKKKHFPEKIDSNLKFLNNLQPKWNRSVTVVHQTKNLYEVDYTQLYDFLKFNQDELNEIRAERLAKSHDPLALMAHSQIPYNYLVFHQDHPSQITYMQHQPPNNNYNPQPSFNQNNMQQLMPNPKDISDATTTMNMALVFMAKAFKLNYSTPTNNNQRISSNPRNRHIAQPGNQNRYNTVQNVRNQVVQNAVQYPGVPNAGNQNGLIVVLGIAPPIANQNANQNGNGNVVAARAEGNANGNNGNHIRCYNCRGLGYYAMNCIVRPRRRDVAWDIDEIEDVNENSVLMANLQQALTSSIQIGKAPVNDSDGTSEVPDTYNCYDNKIFNMFTQEEQYTKLLDLISEPHQVQQNDSNVIPDASSVEQSEGKVDQNPATSKEIRAHFESLYNNLAAEVERVNMVNRKMRETNADLTTELARYKGQEKCFKINQEKYDTLERGYQKMNGNITNLSSSTHQEIHKILKDEIDPIVNQVDVREADDSLDKTKVLEIENERILRAVVNQDIMSIVQNNYVVDTSDLHIELDRTKEKLESCIIKTEKEYATLWNDWYKNVRNANMIKFRMILPIMTCKTKSNGYKLSWEISMGDETNVLLKPVTSNSVPSTRESTAVKNDKVIASGMFRINPFKTFREVKHVPNKPLRASIRTKPITVSQPSVIHKKIMNSNSNGSSSTGVDNTAKIRRPQPKSNTKNDMLEKYVLQNEF
ncbi:hypothetical protein Tco_0792101 [Tanacetum coccineum]